MQKSIRVYTKDLPDPIKECLKVVGYGAQDIGVEVSDTIDAQVIANDGQKGFTMIVELSTGKFTHREGSWSGGSPEMKRVDVDNRPTPLLGGFAVIKGTTGYPRTFATVTLNPAHVLPLLPVHKVTDRQRSILEQFCSLSSKGRKDEWERNPESKPSSDELDELVNLGLLKRNKVGAISVTVEGQNAL